MNAFKCCTTLMLVALLNAPVAMAAEAKTPPPPGWQRNVEVGVNVLQSSYSQNWNGGEKGSINWAVALAAKFENQMSENFNWRNSLKLAYGQNHQQNRDADGNLRWLRPDKSNDVIDFESVGLLTNASGWSPFAALGFTSQFRDLTDAEQRELSLNPLTFRESAGISRRFIAEEKQKLEVRLGLSMVQSSRKFFLDPAPATATGSNTAVTAGVELVVEYLAQVLEDRVTWESKLTVDQPLTYSGKSVFEDGFTSVAMMPADIAGYTTTMDMDWDNTFTTAITKVISVKLFTRWVYDKYDNSVKPVVGDGGNLLNEADVFTAIRKAGQFKQTLALGMSYKF